MIIFLLALIVAILLFGRGFVLSLFGIVALFFLFAAMAPTKPVEQTSVQTNERATEFRPVAPFRF